MNTSGELRCYIRLVEAASIGVPPVTVDAVLERADTDRDLINSWLTRAYDTFNGGPISAPFRAEVQTRISRAVQEIEQELTEPLTLYRGLTRMPRTDGPPGRHWTTKRSVAERYGSHIMTAIAQPEWIDWIGTVARRIGWPEEHEISLWGDAPVAAGTLSEAAERLDEMTDLHTLIDLAAQANAGTLAEAARSPADNLVREAEAAIGRFHRVQMFQIEATDARQVHLETIVVSPRGAGEGTAVMTLLCDLADRYGVTLGLDPDPLHGGSRKRLKQFYRRFGFVDDPHGFGMVRTPGEIKDSLAEAAGERLDEISRPDTLDAADARLVQAGYHRLDDGNSHFGRVYGKDGVDYVLKLFNARDAAYLAYLALALRHPDNPHFPKVLGRPVKVTDAYYAIRVEALAPIPVEMYKTVGKNISRYLKSFEYDLDASLTEVAVAFMEEHPTLKAACDLIATTLFGRHGSDIAIGNLMMRGTTVVLTDPVI